MEGRKLVSVATMTDAKWMPLIFFREYTKIADTRHRTATGKLGYRRKTVAARGLKY
jgi:hypothetical protein